MNSVKIFEKISRISLYGIAVLIPLWFLPITQEVLEYQKQTLLVLLVFLGVAAWLGSMVYGGEIRFRPGTLHILPLVLLGAVGLSTVFSAWRYGSFWGWPLDETDSFLTLLAFVLLYVFLSQSVKGAKHVFSLLAVFVVAGTAAVAFALLQMKGVFLLPFDFASAPAFNTIGSTNSAAMFAAILLPLAFGLASAAPRFWKGAFWAVGVLLFFALALLDFFAAWLAAIAGLVVLLAFDVWSARGQQQGARISLPMVFLLVSLFFVIMDDFSLPGAPNAQAEVSPSWSGELEVMRGVFAESPFAALLGSGPGTFVFDYTKFKSLEINETIFWNVRFQSGATEALDWLVTKGVLGFLALVALAGAGVLLGGKKLLRGRSAMGTGVLAAFAGASVSLFVYPANFVLWFAFWLLLGAIGFLAARRQAAFSLSAGPSVLALGSSFALLLLLVFGAGLLMMAGQKYYAQVEHAKGVQASSQGDIAQAIRRVESAAEANSSADVYWRDLAQLYLQRVNRIAGDQTLSAGARSEQMGAAVNSAVQAAQEAAKQNPANAANWNVQGFVYRNLIGIQGADQFARAAYEKAAELEPASPFPLTEIGRVVLLQAQALQSRDVKEALDSLERAVELKRDYAPAHYLLALVYEQQGSPAEAIAKLEETKLVAPQDVGLAFQLGVVYYRRDELGKARDELERAKALNPRYSNARYMLGLTYDKLGRRADAQAEFAAVSALNPDNREVKDILANLAAGRSALSGIVPDQPPIQENPEEIAPEGQ